MRCVRVNTETGESVGWHIDRTAKWITETNDDYRAFDSIIRIITIYDLDAITLDKSDDQYLEALEQWRNQIDHSTQ